MGRILPIIPLACAVVLLATHGLVVVTGESMRPALARGDIALYRRAAHADVGEIVVFAREGGGLVVHRVVAHGGRGELRTKGDANDAVDPVPVIADRIRGRIVVRLPTGSVTGG